MINSSSEAALKERPRIERKTPLAKKRKLNSYSNCNKPQNKTNIRKLVILVIIGYIIG
jgi:hypothetical protein